MLLKYNFYISKGFKLKKHFVNFAIFNFFWVKICKLDFEALLYVQNMHIAHQNDAKSLFMKTVALILQINYKKYFFEPSIWGTFRENKKKEAILQYT